MGVTSIDIGEIGSKVEPLDLMPVGYVYMSFDSTSPAELFGGTWEQIVNRVIRAANGTGTGGADSITLTVNQMPSHHHEQFGSIGVITSGDSENTYYAIWGNKNQWAVSTEYTGGGGAFSNLPAYQNVYTWKRVA